LLVNHGELRTLNEAMLAFSQIQIQVRNRMTRRLNRPALVTALMAIVAMLTAIDATIVRLLANEVHPFVIGFSRSLFGLLAVMPWIIRRVDLTESPYRWLHGIRAGMKLLALVSFFVAFANAPLAEVTAISFTAPIFLTLGGWLLLRERMVLSRALALLVGFGGILLVIQPGSGGISIALLFALAGALITAAIQLILKRMSMRDTTDRLVAWNLLTMVPLALVPAIIFWSTPSLVQLALLITQGLLGALNMTLVTRALSLADVSFIAPLDFLRLPLVAALAYLMFGEIPEVSTWIGAAVIFGATMLVAGGTRFIHRDQTDLQ
jgi:drug/metabolite transporter (DMT)-like permease